MVRNNLAVAEREPFRDELGRDLIAKRRFRAMNTDVEVTLQDWRFGGRLPVVEEFFGDFERRFSRFLADSELSVLNANAGRPRHVSTEMIVLLWEAARLHVTTGGVFDPAVLRAIEAAGYDRSFDAVARDSREAPLTLTGNSGTFGEIDIDPPTRTVTLPRCMRIDLGGIGKGFAVDRAVELLGDAGAVLVSAGGDLYGRGDGPYGDGWLIAVTSADGSEIDRIILHDQAVATSTTALRTWRRDGRTMHHLIDPRTGQPSDTGLTSVTVIARTTTEADVFAKTALILGLDEGLRFLREQKAQALFVLDRGDVITTDCWPGSTGR